MDELELIFNEKELIRKQLAQMIQREDELKATSRVNEKQIDELHLNIEMCRERIEEIDEYLEHLSRTKDNPDDDLII